MENRLDEPYTFTDKFYAAIRYAAELHRTQARKGTQIPYISHLMIVAGMVIEDGGNEEEVIAALLHDAVEDQGGAKTREEIRKRFGEKIAGIVDECSDSDIEPKPPWKECKEAYLEHLGKASPSALRISLADKLHNARSIVADVSTEGSGVWERFNAPPAELFWYYRSLLEIYKTHVSGSRVREYETAVQEMERLLKKKQDRIKE